MSETDASIDVVCTLALRGVLLAVAADFQGRTGLALAPTCTSTNKALGLIAQGTHADVTILTREGTAQLVREAVLNGESAVDIACSRVGLAVRAGAQKPDIGTADALRRTLLGAASVAFSRVGASGIHFAGVIERLGIAHEVRRKAHIGEQFVGEALIRGEAEIAVQQISELKAVGGIDIVGPLPPEVQKLTVFTAAIARAARHPHGARELIARLADPALAPLLVAQGLELPDPG